MKSDPHSRNLRTTRWSDVSATFFITKSLQPKKAALDSDSRRTIVAAFHFATKHERIYLRAFVVMPDHWHGLFALREPWTLPRFMHDLMSYIGRKTYRRLQALNTQWQDGYYDTHVKTTKQFEYIAHYIEQNPVVKGWVESADQWDASSASCSELVTEPWPILYD